jgi:hypothetical protein
MVAAVVLACGDAGLSLGDNELGLITERDGLSVLQVSARPGKDEIDPQLAELDGRRLIVSGCDADLAAVVLRLLRTERLAKVEIGFVPTSTTASTAASTVARIWQLPRARAKALALALTGQPRPVPLIRDDNGGVLVGLGTIDALDAVAYCDDTRVLSGAAPQLRVTPDPAGLRVEVVKSGLLRRGGRPTTGRACQIGGELSEVVSDGVPHDRPMPRWTWYRHTEDLRLIR